MISHLVIISFVNFIPLTFQVGYTSQKIDIELKHYNNAQMLIYHRQLTLYPFLTF